MISFREVWDSSHKIMDQHLADSKLPDDIRKAIERYDNPRKLPTSWLAAYLSRDRCQLALDVMRAFDQNHDLRRQVKNYKLKIAALTVVITLLLKGVDLLLFR